MDGDCRRQFCSVGFRLLLMTHDSNIPETADTSFDSGVDRRSRSGSLGQRTKHTPTLQNDDELIARIARRDRKAFESFYDQYAPTAYGILLKILGDRAVADEALQETFIQVWRTAESFDRSRGTALGWLISIGRSRAIDRIRSERVRQARENEAAIEDERSFQIAALPSGFRNASISELREAVREALSGIPEEQREALYLAYYGGMTQREIAEKLEQPLGTVKTRILLGMKKLRSKLRNFYLSLALDSEEGDGA